MVGEIAVKSPYNKWLLKSGSALERDFRDSDALQGNVRVAFSSHCERPEDGSQNPVPHLSFWVKSQCFQHRFANQNNLSDDVLPS